MNKPIDYAEMFKKRIDELKEKVKEKKNNINSNYTLAKLDFTTIDNMNDSIEVYEKIVVMLDNLQNRIVDRNTQ